jgi:hypothetical protein
MTLRGASFWLLVASKSILPLSASQITLSYTQYFDYNLAGIVGHPSETWSAAFDPSLQPASPFPNTPVSVSQDFLESGLVTTSAPAIIWTSGEITGAAPADFTLGGMSYLSLPYIPFFVPCSLPCSEVGTNPDQAVGPSDTDLIAQTPDNYAALAYSPPANTALGPTEIPEPASRWMLGIALLILAIRAGFLKRGCLRGASLCLLVMSQSIPLCASPITVTYTQYFDYSLPGIVGVPSATWSATFDPSLQPQNPFPSTPLSVNQDFVLSGLSTTGSPGFIWESGDIAGASPANFSLGGTSYVSFPFFPLFALCSLPCSETATHADQALGPAGPTDFVFDQTPDSYAAVAAGAPTAVPELAPRWMFGIALVSMVIRSTVLKLR